MKRFLQILENFVPKIGFGFEKYLVAICMLIGVQISAFAQYNFLEAPAGSTMIRAGIVHVNPGDDITLKVPFAAPGTPVKWEYRLKRDEPRSLMDSETDVNLDLTNIQQDGEYIATVNVFGVPTTYRMIVSCATIYTNTTSACPNTPVQLTVKGGQFSDNGKYERTEGPGWRTLQKSEFAYNTFKDEWIVQADREFSARASFDYGYYSNDIATYKTNSVDVSLLTDCKAECLQTSTGEYYVGTDFDPNKESANKIPQDIVNHFGDYHIELKEADLKDYWLGTNTEKFFGSEQIPFKDKQTGVEGKNNYMFLQNANARVCELWFYPVSEFVGKTYKYKMRIYLQKEKGCQIDPNAKFKARTGQGKQTTDRLEGAAYWNKNGELIKKAVGYEEGDMTLSFAQLIDLSEVKDYDMIMVDIVFDGKFPDSPNGLSSFKFMPEFAQMGCWKVAIDYISAEIENVCLSPQVLCSGEYTTAHAAGYPDDSEFKWFKKVGDTWVEDTLNYDKPDAKIQAEKGLTTYKLEVDIPNVGLRTQEFTVSGNDCMINRPSQIVGGTFCFSNVDTKTVKRYIPNVVDGSKDLSFEWAMYKPDNSVWFDSKNHADSHFQVLTSDEFKEDPTSENYNPKKNDVLEMTLDLADTAEIKEGDYKLEMRLMKTVGPTVSLDTVMDTIVHIYRTPDITLKLTGERFNEISLEDNKTICPSDIHREVIANAQNGFASPYSSSYIYTWSSLPGNEGVFTLNSEDPTKATINLSKIPEICSGNLDSVQFSVKVEIDGCAGLDKNKYGVEKPVDPTIDCSSLIGKKDTIDVPMGKEVATFRIPFPDFTSGCDSIPELTVVITPNRDEIKDTLVIDTIKVLKNEIGKAEVLTITLPWDTYDFHYTVTDGCGKKDECHANIVVIKRYGPDVACDSILDLDEINGDFNDATSSKCNAIFDAVNIPIPVLMDRNDERGTKITGEYAGRRHFLHKQDRDVLKATAEERSKFDTIIGLYDEYEMEYSYILWRFTNDAGNSSYCVQEVLVRDTAKPQFDCNDIDPFVFRPVTEKGKCSIEFKDFWDELKAKNYNAFVSCPEPGYYVPGELHEDSITENKVTDIREFYVGVNDTIYWQFIARHDYGNNVKYCPQVINAFSGDTIPVDCEAIAERSGIADSGTCEVDASKLDIPSPTAIEPCTNIVVHGVGTRSDNKPLDAPYRTGDTYITWVFKGENSFPDTCVTHVLVNGNRHFDIDCDLLFPKRWIDMPDCEPMDITLEPKEIPDPCVAGYMSESVPYIVNGTDSTQIELTHNFPIGETFVTWMFWDYTHSVSDFCIQSIHLRDTVPPDVNCDTLKDSHVLLHGVCDIPFADLRDSLGKKAAIEHCTQDTIWGEPYLLDTITGKRTEFPSLVKVGHYPIQWVFANDSLTTKEATCDKMLYVNHDMGTPFNCETLKSPLQLLDTTGLCKVPLNPDLLPIPHAQDPCVVDFTVYAHGYVQLLEKGEFIELCYYDSTLNKEVYLFDLPLGGHKVKWRFENKYSSKVDSCEQLVKVNNDIIDRIDCTDLAEYVHYTMRNAGAGATFQQVVDSGLIVPRYDDPCGVLDTIYTRNDGLSIYDIYPVSTITYITWTFRDTTENANREKVCHTTVEVSNGATPVMECPDLPGKYACLEALPAQIATFEEFVALGGKLTSNGVDVTEYAVPSTFKCDTLIEGDKCDYKFTRKYSIRNQRDSLSECKQVIPIKDTIPPVWMDGAASLTKVFDCDHEDFFPTNLRANDECSNDIISNYLKVSKLDDIVDGIYYTVASTRSDNPADCDYYNYKVIHNYQAVDRCRNKSSILTFEAQVQDTFAPVLSVPGSWRDSMVVAEYGVPCVFTVPDLTKSLPDGSVSDVCDPNAVKYFTITQKPEAGTHFNPNLGSQYVTLFVTDPCGLSDTVKHLVYVPTRTDVIDIEMTADTFCKEEEILIKNDRIVSTTGRIWTFNKYTRTWSWKDNTTVYYDYYRGTVAPENLIFSNNPRTYSHLFDLKSERDSLILNNINKSGLYTIVAMDTIRLCTDTAFANITVHSGPSVFVDAQSLLVCEYDSIHLVTDEENLFDKYHVSFDDNGEEVCDTCHGWLLNGKKYEPGTMLEYTDALSKLQYYASNKCATYSSSDWIAVGMKQRMSPDNLMLTTDPTNPARVYANETAHLNLITKYKPEVYMWYRVKGSVDGSTDDAFDKNGNVRDEYIDSNFEQDTLFAITYAGEAGNKVRELRELGDTAQYYVLLLDNVCPAVPSNVVSIDVIKKLPTAFTPQNSIGANDVFMEGHKVIIFNRYGQKMTESDNGWDGTCRGEMVDPGVYFYEVIINNGEKHKGTIEVVYFK